MLVAADIGIRTVRAGLLLFLSPETWLLIVPYLVKSMLFSCVCCKCVVLSQILWLSFGILYLYLTLLRHTRLAISHCIARVRSSW